MDDKKKLYDEMSRVLTEFEENTATGEDLYDILVKIQVSWESVVTAEEI